MTQYFFTDDYVDLNVRILSYIPDQDLQNMYVSKSLVVLLKSDQLWSLKIRRRFGDRIVRMKSREESFQEMYADLVFGSFHYKDKPYLYEWAEINGERFESWDADFVFQDNRFRVLKWLVNRNIYPSQNTINSVVMKIRGGRLEILEWLASLNLRWRTNIGCGGQIPIQEYQARYQHFIVSESSQKYIAKKLQILKWLAQPPRNRHPTEWDIEGIGYGRTVES